MTTTDTTTIMLRMLEEMQHQRRADLKEIQKQRRISQKQRHADMKEFKDLFAAEMRRRRDIQGIRPVLRSGVMAEAAITFSDRFPLAKGGCDGHKTGYAECYFSNGPHKSDGCLHRTEFPAVSSPSATGIIVFFIPQVLKIPYTESQEPDDPMARRPR